MSRPIVLSIAGIDPSGGAGLLADIKTFEMHKTLGFGVCSAITYQSENKFEGLHWLSDTEIINQLSPLVKKHEIKIVKIGLIQDLKTLETIINYLTENNISDLKIIWDPILSASAGFIFHNAFESNLLSGILKRIHLITPNKSEFDYLNLKCPNITELTRVLLKGGHNGGSSSDDRLIWKNKELEYKNARYKDTDKHGTGCILSAAIASNLALNYSIEDSCKHAKDYVNKILLSNASMLGYHTI